MTNLHVNAVPGLVKSWKLPNLQQQKERLFCFALKVSANNLLLINQMFFCFPGNTKEGLLERSREQHRQTDTTQTHPHVIMTETGHGRCAKNIRQMCCQRAIALTWWLFRPLWAWQQQWLKMLCMRGTCSPLTVPELSPCGPAGPTWTSGWIKIKRNVFPLCTSGPLLWSCKVAVRLEASWLRQTLSFLHIQTITLRLHTTGNCSDFILLYKHKSNISDFAAATRSGVCEVAKCIKSDTMHKFNSILTSHAHLETIRKKFVSNKASLTTEQVPLPILPEPPFPLNDKLTLLKMINRLMWWCMSLHCKVIWLIHHSAVVYLDILTNWGLTTAESTRRSLKMLIWGVTAEESHHLWTKTLSCSTCGNLDAACVC